MNNCDMIDINVEVEALNLEGIEQNVSDYVENKVKINISESVFKAQQAAVQASTSATQAAGSAMQAADAAEQVRQMVESYYTKAEIDDNIATKQSTANLTTTLTAESTDEQYPSAKCVYDIIGNVETLLSEV